MTAIKCNDRELVQSEPKFLNPNGKNKRTSKQLFPQRRALGKLRCILGCVHTGEDDARFWTLASEYGNQTRGFPNTRSHGNGTIFEKMVVVNQSGNRSFTSLSRLFQHI